MTGSGLNIMEKSEIHRELSYDGMRRLFQGIGLVRCPANLISSSTVESIRSRSAFCLLSSLGFCILLSSSGGSVFSHLLSATTYGIKAHLVQVETHIATSLPSFSVVGLPDNAVRESRERVYAAIKTSGFLFPRHRLTVNLAPADLKKEGSAFDLPIAIGLLAASDQISGE